MTAIAIRGVLEPEPPRRVVIPDSSVVVKWFVGDETDRDRALALRDAFTLGHVRLVSPPLLLAEVANALRYRTDFDARRLGRAVESLFSIGLEIAPLTPELLKQAVRISYHFDTALYDALFVALAEAEGGEFVTADERFARRLRDLHHVKFLRTFHLDPT